MTLQDKTAIITGAGRGIGKRLAIAFAAQGARVGMMSRTLPELHMTHMEIAHAGGASLVVAADVADYAQVEKAADAVRREFGPVDILVNAAGVQGPIGPTASTDPRAWAEVLQINLIGAFHCCRAVLPEMIKRRSGKIINISGGGSSNSRPFFSGYAASKVGLVRFTETLADEVAEHNIQVNALSPGATYTAMTDQVLAAGEEAGEKAIEEARHTRDTRGVPPEKQIALALFLVSPRSNHISGKLISVHDDWHRLEHATMTPDHFTLRRISKP
ncbi:MAG TPA: SDR family oxidoreductase [Bryobacterales bacterium]|nr:SDR family oxidoreductase [Bryobacterales bacterium]